MKKSTQKVNLALSLSMLLSISVGCNQANNTDANAGQEVVVEEVAVIEEEPTHLWVVREHHINQIPVTSKGETETEEMKESVKKEESETPLDRESAIDDEYQITSQVSLNAHLVDAEYEALEEVSVTEAIIPLGETETLISYSGNGKVKDTLQIVSDANGEILYIMFSHKHHTDEYDVQNGMTAKEVKHLRKDVKHMEKNGKYFLYSDTSNIMYVLDATDAMGDEYEEVDLDQLTVEAIMWKDKKHHKKDSAQP